MRSILLYSCLFLGAITSFGQKKVKYKDLIILLNAKQYDQAEPFLKRYIKDNDDNPNAYLFMGIIFQEKAATEDVLKQTEMVIQHSDSAIINYDIAYKTIDEREVRKNDEYYQAYNRRDMRTGEFGVTLSDVKLDIEKKIKTLKDRKENVKNLKQYYASIEILYNKSIQQFQEMKGKLTENRFYLLSDSKTIDRLKNFALLCDSVTTAFDNYKSTSKLVGKTGYNHTLTFIPIKSFAKDGGTSTDFNKDDLKLWDFKGWTNNALEILDKDIEPMRAELITTDVLLNKLGEKIKKDSVSVLNRLDDAVSKILIARLKKFDDDPLPVAVFNIKISELTYGSLLIKNKPLKDTIDVNLKMTLAKAELKAINSLDSLTKKFSQRDLENDLLSYPDFVQAGYGKIEVISSLVNSLKEYASHEIEKKDKELITRANALNWAIVGTDSIPLSTKATIGKNPYKMLITKQDLYTAGLKYGADSLATGYFYTITPSRIPDISTTFNVDKANFKKISLPVLKALSIDDGKSQIYFVLIYSEEKVKEKHPISIAKIYRSDGLAWSVNYMVDGMPAELTFAQDTGDLSVKLTNTSGEIKIMAIDKNGKMLK